MAALKKTYKSPLEKPHLNRIAEEQELKLYKQSGDNIASILRRRALLPNPGLVLKDSRQQIPYKKILSASSESSKCVGFLKKEKDRAPLRAQSVQNISKFPSSGSQSTQGCKKKDAVEDNIKRAVSVQNVTAAGAEKPSPCSTTYNAELLMKFDEEKKSLEAKISELSQLSEKWQTELEDIKRKRAEELELHRRAMQNSDLMRAELLRMEAANEALKRQLRENGISVEHFTDTEKLFLIGSIDPSLRGISALESSDDLRVSRDEINSIAQRYMLSTGGDMTNGNLDRHNSISVDRGLNAVCIADITDRYLQMQESQHCVNEELQATLQELSDLQENVNELSEVNRSLKGDNDILMESLCATSEKLEYARIQVENLKSLLIRDVERFGSNGNSDNHKRELHLTSLLKCAQQEKEELLLKQTEYLRVISSMESKAREARDSIWTLEESLRIQQEKSKHLEEENSALELRVERLERVARTNGTVAHDREEDYSVARLDNLLKQREEELERLKEERAEAIRELRQQNEFLREKVVLQTQHNRELDRELKAASSSLRQSRAELSGCKKSLADEREEWAQFQSDLLTAVVVANNLNAEKDCEVKRLKSEQKLLQVKYQHLIEHISSKGFLDGPISPLETLIMVEANGEHLSDGTETFKNPSCSPKAAKEIKSTFDLITSTPKELVGNPLQTDGTLVSPIKIAAENFHPVLPAAPSSLSGSMGEEHLGAKINGILMKTLNGERRDEKDKSSASMSVPSTSLYLSQVLKSDPLLGLVKSGGSKRNALLQWCQNKLKDFGDIEVTNFSSSWNDGIALCALLYTYLPQAVPYSDLGKLNVKQRFQCAFRAAKDAGLDLGSEDDLNDLVATDRPSWQMVYALVTAIYRHFEVESKNYSECKRSSVHR